MARLNIDRQNSLEPIRIEYSKVKIEKLGFKIINQTDKFLQFIFKGSIVTYYPYSGWHTGKTIKDGRGIKFLLNQIKEKPAK